jgi:hypothetical protein
MNDTMFSCTGSTSLVVSSVGPPFSFNGQYNPTLSSTATQVTSASCDHYLSPHDTVFLCRMWFCDSRFIRFDHAVVSSKQNDCNDVCLQPINLIGVPKLTSFGIGAANGFYFNDVIGIGAVSLSNQAFLADNALLALLPPLVPRPMGTIRPTILVRQPANICCQPFWHL